MNEAQMVTKLRRQAHQIERSRVAGEELIAAAREVVAAYKRPVVEGVPRLWRAIAALKSLVGCPEN